MNQVPESLRMRASKSRLSLILCTVLVLLLLTIYACRASPLFIFLVPFLALGAFGFIVGIFTNRLDATLTHETITYGTVFGSKCYRWRDIQAIYVAKASVGKEVLIELRQGHEQPLIRRLPHWFGTTAEEFATTLAKWHHEYGSLHNN